MSFVDRISIEIAGRDEADHLTVKSFLKVAGKTFDILKKLDVNNTLQWRIERVQMNSPLELVYAAEPRDEIGAYDSDISEQCLDLFDSLQRGVRPSLRVPVTVFTDAAAVISTMSNGVSRIHLRSKSDRVVTPNYERIKSALHELTADKLSDDYHEHTSLEGVLKTSSTHGGSHLCIYDRITGDAIHCKLGDEMFKELFASSNMNRRVSVTGLAFYKKEKPVSISVESYEFLPSLQDVMPDRGPSGLNITGGMDSVEYLRSIRDAR